MSSSGSSGGAHRPSCGFVHRAVLVVGLLLATWSARAGFDPDRQWYTLKTAHFAVHSYHVGHDEAASVALARRSAAFLEEAYDALNDTLGWKPQERIEVTIFDDVDSANGFARVVPYNHINLLAFPPPGTSSLGDYDDWLRLLIYHEYAHIVHLDNATGIPEIVNTILGKTYKPNQGLPRWITEGLAVWIESRTSGAGRVTASIFQMYSRAMALENKLPSMSELSGPPLFQPGGSAWYMFGGYTFQAIADTAGPAAIRQWTRSYGRRLIPYSINHTMRATTGKGIDHWYGEALAGIKKRAQSVRTRVAREGRVLGVRRTNDGQFKSAPVVTPDGKWVLFSRNDGRHATFMGRAPVKDATKFEDLVKCDGGCGDIEPIDTQSFYMRGTRFHRRVNSWSDILRFPMKALQRGPDGQKITRGARAQHPRLSSDRRRLWVIKASWGKTWLEGLDPVTGDVQYRWDPPAWARLGAPAPSLDGRTVYLTMHHASNRDIYALDVATKTLKRLTLGSSIEVGLRMGPKGRYLFYSSDADGVFNLYARDLQTQATLKLTNVLGGAFGPAPTPDLETVFYRGWTAGGWELYELPFSPDKAQRVAVADPRPPRKERPVTAVEAKRQPYTPLPTLLPRSWFPTWQLDSTGLATLGLVLGGLDVSDRFGTTLALEYNFARQDVSFFLDLDLRVTWPDLSLRIGRYTWDGTMTLGDVSDDYRGEVYYANFNVGLPIPDIVTPMTWNTGFTVDFSRGLKVPNLRHTPDENYPSIPREGVSTAWTMSFGWSDAEQPLWAITPIRGGSGSFGMSLRHPAIGSSRNDFRLTYALKRFIQMPFQPEHVLVLKGVGGWATNSAFTLGGIPQQDIFVDLLNQVQGASTYLRGFEAGAFRGRAYHLVTTEYRFPIFRARTGIEALPLFFRDLHAAVFADVGVAYNEPFEEADLERIRGSVGVELRLDVELLFGFGANLRLGYARGLGDDGIDHVYLMVAPPP